MKTFTAPKTAVAFFFFLFLSFSPNLFAQDDLDQYIQRLKKSEASGGKETAFMSAGSYFLYGQGYFETRNYFSAANSFEDALRAEPENPYANYQLALSLIRQNDKHKTERAQTYLQKAFALNPSLKARYAKDVPAAQAATENKQAAGLEGYVEKLKYSNANGGRETEMNSAGREALYGLEYYERNAFDHAETRFRLALAKEPENPYVNYLMAVSLAAQNKAAAANPFLARAVAGDPSLGSRFQKEVAKAKADRTKKQPIKEDRPAPAKEPKKGGALLFGNYICSQTVWNGPNRTPAFSAVYKGYFLLRPNGTYRWLDNGAEGRYSYNAATGVLKWESGFFAGQKPKLTSFVLHSATSAQATLNFTDDYRWECGCEKK